MDLKPTFIYGNQYWRPPNPPRTEHRTHLKNIKRELGFDMVKCRLLWNWHHREPDRFSFDEVHEIFDICEQLELGVLLELNLETAPYWLEQEHPDTRYVNANGRAVELGAQEATPTGGHPGLCFHHPAVIEQGQRFLSEIVRQFKDRKALRLYDCWNEPHLEPAWCNNMWGNTGDRVYCYCESSRAAFRRWLANRYGSIDRLNATWGRAYTSFEQINPPILQGTFADWLDWFRFWFDELQTHMRWRVRTIKELDPQHPVASHSGAVPPVLARANACIHNWKLAEEVDLWGTSFAPQMFHWDLARCAQVFELTRGAAGQKPFWVSEMASGAGNVRGFRKSRLPRYRDMHVWNWLAAALGSRGTMHWCYLTERTGHEAGGYGLVRPDGRHTPRSLGARDVAATLKQHQDILARAEVPTQVAVLYDPDVSTLLFAMELDDSLYGRAHAGYYRSVWEADLVARYVTPETLGDVNEPVLIAPMAMMMRDEVAEHLADFVRQGGVLIAEARTGMFDERGWLRPTWPPKPLAEAAGLIEDEMISSDAQNGSVVTGADGTLKDAKPSQGPAIDPIHLGPTIHFTHPLPAEVPVQEFLSPLELNGAQASTRCCDLVAAARHQFGQGQVYYFGTYLGLALESGKGDGDRLVHEILRRHAQPVVSGDRLRPRLLRSDAGALLIVFNGSSAQSVNEQVRVPDEYARARNIATGETFDLTSGEIPVVIEPDNVAVYRLQS